MGLRIATSQRPMGTGMLISGVVAIAMIALSMGCRPGNPRNRQPVSGRATFAGQPLDHGIIEFIPQNQADGIQSGAAIHKGAFEIPTLRGLPPGKYLVRIFSASEAEVDQSVPPDLRGLRPGKERIPPAFNIDSNIVVEVTSEGPQEFTFTIPP